MHPTDFDYHLPASLIAQQPVPRRTHSRLLTLDGRSGDVGDHQFEDIQRLLKPGDVLVLNDTRVIAARLYGRKRTGGRLELMTERILDDHTILALARFNKKLTPGAEIEIDAGPDTAGPPVAATVVDRQGEFFTIRFADATVDAVLDDFGHIPIPPYIQRPDGDLDRDRYQTVYARRPGAVAAPTAGLHFDTALLRRLEGSGVEIEYITLHVGAGTFQPLRGDDIPGHVMHSERIRVLPSVCAAVDRARRRQSRVIAVGTTSARALETAFDGSRLAEYEGETDIFIYPGFRFNVVDALVTNFHLPQSTLLMMVCAFAGTRHTLNAYHHAVTRGYRFYSYGDAMFVTPQP